MNTADLLALLKSGEDGVVWWNNTFGAGLGVRRPPLPILDRLDLRGADLRGIDFSGVMLRLANLRGADLRDAILHGADLEGAELDQVRLERASLSAANMSGCSVREGRLKHAVLISADLTRADFTHADLELASIAEANLTDAILVEAGLEYAWVLDSDLRDADLRRAELLGTNVARCNLAGVELGFAICSGAVFAAVDMSGVRNLSEVVHHGPSYIDTETLYRSHGKIPDRFLRGCGVQEEMIRHLPSIIGASSPIQFYSCFISYSTADEALATRLHNDFQAAGIRCWKWNHDARTGRSVWGEIDQAIRRFDKLVLLASESSLRSPAVNREIDRALVQEDERQKRRLAGENEGDGDVLFPVRLDDYVFTGWQHERKVDVTKKVIADATGWEKDNDKYRRVVQRLVRDLELGRPIDSLDAGGGRR